MILDYLYIAFLLVLPAFGKAIDYQESIILYGIPIFYLLNDKNHRLSKLSLSKSALTFTFSLVFLYFLSFIFSKNPGISYYSFLNFLSVILIVLIALSSNLDLNKFFNVYIAFAFFYSLIFLLNKLGFLSLGNKPASDNFIRQIWGHSYLADYIVLVVPILLYRIFQKSGRLFFNLFSLTFFLAILLLTNSRSSLLSLLISLLFFPSSSKRILNFLHKFIIGLSFLGLVFLFQNAPLLLKSTDGDRMEYWTESIFAFKASPLLGNGPGNFFYINKLYQTVPQTNTNYSHSSLFQYLSENGLLFTIIFFAAYIFGLVHQWRHQRLLFILCLTSLLNSFLDPSWNSTGIFSLTLFFLFYQNQKAYQLTSKKTLSTIFLVNPLIIILSIFFISKTTSDFLYITSQPKLSIYFDFFNPNPRHELITNQSLIAPDFVFQSTNLLYSHNHIIIRKIINSTSLPQNEDYYYRLFSLDPIDSGVEYLRLADYYQQTNNISKLNSLLELIKSNMADKYLADNIGLSAHFYRKAYSLWQKSQYKASLPYFQSAQRLSPNWGIFYLEYANALWHSGQQSSARELLNTCQTLKDPKSQCQSYLSSHIQEFDQPFSLDAIKQIESIPPSRNLNLDE